MREISKEEFKKSIIENVKNQYRRTIDEATPQQIFQAVSYAIKDVIIDDWIATQKQFDETGAKKVYYLSMEFLMGRALGNNIINLGAKKAVKEALEELGFDLNAIEDQEPDPHLEMVDSDVLQPALWNLWQPWDTQLTAAVSATVMVCSNRRSKTVFRWKCRITG